jgi:hypothetical protein
MRKLVMMAVWGALRMKILARAHLARLRPQLRYVPG